jgi:hypothetical protein
MTDSATKPIITKQNLRIPYKEKSEKGRGKRRRRANQT